jgi:Protein of unknown function (DUF4232)
MTQLSRLCPQWAGPRRRLAAPAVLARGDDPPRPPAVLAGGDDPPRPPAVATAAAAAAIIAALAGLTACGSAAPGGQAAASPPASNSPAASHSASSPTAGSRPAAAVAECSVSALRVRLDGSAAGAAAGNSYVPLEFTNTSARSCTLPEYPAVAFASGAAGPSIGAPAALARGTHPRTIVLAPRALAHSWLQIAAAANYPASTCKPVQAKGLLVSFAGSTPAAFLAHPFEACAAAMRGTDVLAVFPVQEGKANRGSAP